MSWAGKSDRDILIETATIVSGIEARLDKKDRDDALVRSDVETRLRALERLRWVIWGALATSCTAGVELAKRMLGGAR